MKRIIISGAFFFAFSHTAQAAEEEIKQCLCQGMDQNVVLQGGAEADCVDETNAVKVGSTEHWAEALGQALHYAAETEKNVRIILYCRQNSDERSCRNQTRRLQSTIAKFSLPIEVGAFSENEVLAKCGDIANREERDTGSARFIPIW